MVISFMWMHLMKVEKSLLQISMLIFVLDSSLFSLQVLLT